MSLDTHRLRKPPNAPQHAPIARWRSARPEPVIERPCGIMIGGNTAPKGSVLSALPSLLYLEVEVQYHHPSALAGHRQVHGQV